MIGPPPGPPSPGPPPPGGPNPVDLFNQIQYIAYVQVAVTVAVLYDHITSLDLEVELIWKRKWSFVTALFLLNRYLGEAIPLYMTSDLIIKPFSARKNGVSPPTLEVQGWGCHVLIWSMQAIMQYRICCLYKHSRRVVLLVGFAFTVEVISMVIIDGLYLPLTTKPTGPQPGVVICKGYTAHWYFASWIPVFGYELIILVLGLRAGICYFKESYSLSPMSRYPLRSILLCDSIMYPIIAFALGTFNVWGWSRPTTHYNLLTAGLFQLFPRILGCRLVLNLREAYYLPFREEFSLNEGPQTLVFAIADDETVRTR